MAGKKRVYLTVSFVFLIIAITYALVFFETKQNNKTKEFAIKTIKDHTEHHALMIDYKIQSKKLKSKKELSKADIISSQEFASYFNAPSEDKDCVYFILSADNSVITSNKESFSEEYYNNFAQLFEKEPFSAFFTKNQSDIFYELRAKNQTSYKIYQISGNEFTCITSKLNSENWTLACVYPYNYIKHQEEVYSYPVYFTLVLVVFAFVIFTYFLQNLIKSNQRLENENEKLITGFSQIQSISFELNLHKKEITFTGDTDFILNTREKIFPVQKFFNDFISRIHEDDKSVIIQLREFLIQYTQTFSNEIRFKCADNQFYWFRISGSKVEKKGLEGEKLAGKIINVNTAQLRQQRDDKAIAETDKLTGLLNKNYTEKKISRYLDNLPPDSFCAMFVVDLDNLKNINGTMGHSMGDLAIRNSAKKISLIFSEKDIIGRAGGDEFCIFMCFKNNVSFDTAKMIVSQKATTLCSTLSEDYFDDKNSVTLTASIGVSIFPEHGTTFKELYHKADSALYFVKQNGKNNSKFYSAELQEIDDIGY